MRKFGDFIWSIILVFIFLFLFLPQTHAYFVAMTRAHPYLMGFIKFCILATMGEFLALRIINKEWIKPSGVIIRAVVWGILGMVTVLVFELFTAGVTSALSKGLLPGSNSKFAFAFFTSMLMNSCFAPTMMAFHRLTDTHIDLIHRSEELKPSLKQVITGVDWNNFISFVVLKTIPLFWIPAHTVTFLLPGEYRILVAALLSIALGAILSLARRKPKHQPTLVVEQSI